MKSISFVLTMHSRKQTGYLTKPKDVVLTVVASSSSSSSSSKGKKKVKVKVYIKVNRVNVKVCIPVALHGKPISEL